jgi:hypothetical protein
MTNKTIVSAEQLAAKEILSLVDQAGGHFASAAVSFVDTAAIFEAIATAAPDGSLMRRLADLGMGLCESRQIEFVRQQSSYAKHVERFESALQAHGDGAVPNHAPVDQIDRLIAQCSHAEVQS